LISTILSSSGFNVMGASTGKDALEVVARAHPDLVLLDAALPDMNDLEVCRRIKTDAALQDTFVVLLLGSDTLGEMRVNGLDFGPDGFIVKGIPDREFLARIQFMVRHRQSRLELEERLQFESLLADISARFVNLPADRIDAEIKEVQRRVCECLRFDLSTLWQWLAEAPDFLTLTHLYRPLGGPPPPEPMNAHEYFPWSLQQFVAGQLVAVSSVEKLPAKAARDQEVWRYYGIKSSLTFPLSVGGDSPMGVLSFNTMRAERSWPEALVRQLQLVAQIFTNALSRKRSEETLHESERRLSLATNASGAGLWIMETETEGVWVSAKTRELFHFAPDEEIKYESFNKVIYPEDRKLVDQAVQRALQSGENLQVEYRILLPDGSIRWIGAHGQRDLKPTGEPYRLMGASLDITERKQMQAQLEDRLLEIEELKKNLEHENIILREEVKVLSRHKEIVGRCVAMREVLAQVDQVAPTDSTVLVIGETGTGKELIARAIHRLSNRKTRPLVTVNCAALPLTLIESELFGREKGAYTGAMSRAAGRFEAADGSTLFLDEIGDLPLDLQVKLLRVLEEGCFERLGSARTLRVNVRILAATNRDLDLMIKTGEFRNDLYYRLSVFPIRVPPLRERLEDIPTLVWAFIKDLEERMGKHIQSIPESCLDTLQNYDWPGNVRELRNVIEHAMIMTRGSTLEVRPPDLLVKDKSEGVYNLQEIERNHVLSVLEKTGWRVAGKAGAAEILGLKPTTLEARMKKLGIHRPRF
jgi:formate hydrogenlyase transcriptional activator